jgi:hypothetical protein
VDQIELRKETKILLWNRKVVACEGSRPKMWERTTGRGYYGAILLQKKGKMWGNLNA